MTRLWREYSDRGKKGQKAAVAIANKMLTIGYFFLLDKIGFTVCSIIFVFLFNTLFAGLDRMKNVKYHVVSLIISVVASLVVSILFGTVFNISLPEGVCTIWIKSLGLTIF